MADEQTIGNRAVVENPANAIGILFLALPFELTIAPAVFEGPPFPALIWTFDINLFPEAGYQFSPCYCSFDQNFIHEIRLL
jgi:hypothetical protein